jgi:hypothetical protein
VVAISVLPTHSLLAIATGLLAGAILFWGTPGFRFAKFLAGGLILAGAIAANWSGMLLSLASYAPYTARAQTDASVSILSVPSVAFGFAFSKLQVLLLPFMAIGLGLLAWNRDALFWRFALAAAAGLLLGPLLMAMPCQSLGLGPLAAVRFVLAEFALPACFVAIVARLSTHPVASRLRGVPLALAASLALGSLAWFKIFNAVNLLGEGGQRTLTSIPNLRTPAWYNADRPERVVTVPYKLPPMALLAYGFDTFDGYVNMIPREKVLFWRDALPIPPVPMDKRSPDRLMGGDLLLLPLTYDYRGANDVSLQGLVRMDLLRLGNVGYVVSYLPLKDPQLRQISGPPVHANPRRSMPFLEKVRADVRHIFDPAPAFVYRLEGSLPRIYFARSLKIQRPAEDRAAFYERIATDALSGDAFVEPDSIRGDWKPGGLPSAEVRAFVPVPGGWDVTIHAPNGGVLIVNTVHLPWWHARVGGQSLQVVPANGIHMAVPVPPMVSGVVSLRYER